MKVVPLFGSGVKSYSAPTTRQRRLNCFYDIRPDGDPSNIIIRGTPGQSLWTTLTDNPIRGWRVVNTLLYVVAGSTLFTVDSGTNVTNLGPVASTAKFVSLTDDSVSLAFVDGVQGYTAALPLGPPTLITDPNFPNGATSIATLDSRSLANVVATRNWDISQQLAAMTWTPFLDAVKENASDILQALDVFNGAIVLWGTQNLEFWQDLGLAPVPYQRINGASQTWGLAAPYSRAFLNNSMIFLAQNPQGGVQVMMLNGYTPVRVSNSDIEYILSTFAVHADAYGLTYMQDGHPMYQITFPSYSRSFLFDSLTGMWSEVQTGVATTGMHSAVLGVSFNGLNLVTDSTTGNIYKLDPNVFTDNGVAIKRQVASRHIRMDGNLFGISQIRLEMETGVGIDVGQGSDPRIMMQISRDGGRTFGPERWKKIGQKGQYRKTVYWDQCGTSRDFVFQFTMTDPVKFVITQAEAVLSPGIESGQ